jgi:serine phosphatase RsbU (regulator of sigma subunit)
VESPPPSEPEYPNPVRGPRNAVADPDRLAAVRASGLLDTEPEEPFDRLTRLASILLDAPLACVTVVDATRSFWKSRVGVETKRQTGRQCPVEESFCQYVIDTGEPLVVPDTAYDTRTRDNISARTRGIAAWAGYPVYSPDLHILGTFCAADTHPRTWTQRDLTVLETLSQAVSREISLRHMAARATALARTLQESLLPPQLPDLPGLQLSARYRPAGDGAEVLGDFFDVFHTGRTSLGVVLGDVAGKGVEAAKVTALAHYTIRAAASRTSDPAAILGQLNTALLTQRPDSERFLTAAYLAIHETRRGLAVTVCSAGHTPVLLRRRDGTLQPVGAHGLVLGLFEDTELTNTRIRLRPGDMLLLYTDGVTEARRGKEQYGDDRLRALVATTEPTSADHLTSTVESAVLTFVGGPPQDDIAVLAIGLAR